MSQTSDEPTGSYLTPEFDPRSDIPDNVAYRLNDFDQPVGLALPEWTPPPAPPRIVLDGHWARLEPLDPERHASALYDAYARDDDARHWTYLGVGPFHSLEAYIEWMRAECLGPDPMFYAYCDQRTGQPVGLGSFMRITPDAGCIEVGHLRFSPLMQRTPIATDSMYQMMRHAFELGYRRYEWKCDSLNLPSRRAATRFGFTFEGIFRQAVVYKGRNRDTAWFSITDQDWPGLSHAFEQWLSPDNFDREGKQKQRLEAFRP